MIVFKKFFTYEIENRKMPLKTGCLQLPMSAYEGLGGGGTGGIINRQNLNYVVYGWPQLIRITYRERAL